jgi:hypothetical protein
MQYPALLPALLGAALLLGACGGGNDGPDAMPPDANPFCVAATEHADLEWIQANIFTPSCSRFTACHQGRALMAGELSLEVGKSHEELVGIASTAFPARTRVIAGDPANSYLMMILGHYGLDVELPEAGTMPYNSPLLCIEMREAIERWIMAGAPE